MRIVSIILLSLVCFAGTLRAGSIVRLVYEGIGGTTVASLTGAPIFPNSPTRTQVLNSLLEAPSNDGDNYGSYLRGWVEAPATGNYTFWIASDDESELWLSPDANPTNKVKIAFQSGVSGPREWDGAPGKKSALIHLVRGQKYYFEVLHKEGGGGDHLAVGWRLPDQTLEQPMSLLHVQQYIVSNTPPAITGQPQNLSIPAHNTAIFSVAVNAAPPPSYQWQQSIDGGINFSSLPGATLSYLTLKGVPLTANGTLFRLVITNSVGSVTSAIASLTVTADTFFPTILSAAVVETPNCLNQFVEVIFSEPMDVVTATEIANYSLTRSSFPVFLAGATINPQRPERVLLQTIDPLKCGAYELTVNNTLDLAANSINPGTMVNFLTSALDCCNQSYTLNLPAGNSMIANQLEKGGNTLAEVLPVVPNGTTLLKWDPLAQIFESPNVFFGGVGWSTPNILLEPGEGALLILPVPANLTFTGGRVPPAPPLLAPSGFSLVSSRVPQPAGFNELLGFAPSDGSLIVQFDSALQLYRTNYFLNGSWHDQAPIAAVGESVFYAHITPVQITTQPAGFTNVPPGTNIIFSVMASGTGPLTYRWRRNGNVIPGADQDTYQILNAQPSDAGSYSVSVENMVGGINSTEVILSFNLPPFAFVDQFGTAPIVLNVATQTLVGSNIGATRQAGEMRHFGKPGGSSVWADWMAPETGIVMFETLGSSFDTLLAAYIGNTLPTLTEVASDDDGAGHLNSRIFFNAVQGTLYRIAVDGFGHEEGNIVLSWQLETTLDTLPVILTQPQSVTVAPNDPVQFAVIATGVPLGYQWYRNGSEIAGATSPTYDLVGAQFSDVGNYRVRITRNGRFIDSRTVGLHIFAGSPGTPLQDGRSNDKFFDNVDLAGLGQNSAGSGPARRVQAVVHGYSGQSLFSTTTSTKDVGEPNHAGEPGGKSEWFAFQADTNGTLYVNTDGSSYNTVLAVYIGPGNSYLTLTNVASDNNSGTNGLTSSLRCSATSNTVYWIAVDGVGAAGGSVKLNYRLVVPLTITNVVTSTTNNGRIIFKVNSTPNLLTKVQASTNLSSTNWISLLTNTPVSGTFNFTNTNTLALPKRFYRAINQF